MAMIIGGDLDGPRSVLLEAAGVLAGMAVHLMRPRASWVRLLGVPPAAPLVVLGAPPAGRPWAALEEIRRVDPHVTVLAWPASSPRAPAA